MIIPPLEDRHRIASLVRARREAVAARVAAEVPQGLRLAAGLARDLGGETVRDARATVELLRRPWPADAARTAGYSDPPPSSREVPWRDLAQSFRMSTSSFTAAADFCSAAFSLSVSLICQIFSTPLEPSWAGTPT